MKRPIALLAVSLVAAIGWGAAAAASPSDAVARITEIRYFSMPGDRVRIELELSEPSEPRELLIFDPPRLVLDFSNTIVQVADDSQRIGVGVVHRVTALHVRKRARVVIHLLEAVPYEVVSTRGLVRVTIERRPVRDAAVQP